MKVSGPDIRGRESTVYKILERLSVAVGLLAIAPLTRIWERPLWLRVLFVLIGATLVVATTYDLLPRWSRRRPVAAGGLSVLVVVAAWAPGRPAPPPETDGWATITSPRSGQSQNLTVREAGGTTDGFVARGACQVPRGYRAVIVSRADHGPGYWLLSDGILGDCVDDDVTHEWTAERVDPSWSGMPNGNPTTIGVIVLRTDLAERAQAQKVDGEPLILPQPAATILIPISRIQ